MAKASTEIHFIIVSKENVGLLKVPVAGPEMREGRKVRQGQIDWDGDEKSTRPIDARLWTGLSWKSITANRLYKTNPNAVWPSKRWL